MTYAAFWVRKAILDALADQPRMVRVPRYQREKNGTFPREVRFDDPIAPGAIARWAMDWPTPASGSRPTP